MKSQQRVNRYLRALIPPFLFSIPRVLGDIYSSPKSKSPDYQDQALVDLVLQKNLILRDQDPSTPLDINSFSVLAAVGLACKGLGRLSVLDFGGGCGHHHLTAKRAFPELQLDWWVVETQMMAMQAASRIQEPGLSFSSEIENILTEKSRFGLIFSNSAIQYTSDPLGTLTKLLSLSFEHIFITRFPVTLDDRPIVYAQKSRISANGPGPAPLGFKDSYASYENHIARQTDVEKLLAMHLRVWHIVDEGPWDYPRFGSQVRTTTYFGFKKPSNEFPLVEKNADTAQAMPTP